jgi:hypothetical protein
MRANPSCGVTLRSLVHTAVSEEPAAFILKAELQILLKRR